jgi:hypothetical protein
VFAELNFVERFRISSTSTYSPKLWVHLVRKSNRCRSLLCVGSSDVQKDVQTPGNDDDNHLDHESSDIAASAMCAAAAKGDLTIIQDLVMSFLFVS